MAPSSDQTQLQPLEMCTQQHFVSGLKQSELYHCYILYNTTTQGLVLYNVVGDCSTSIEALNLTPGDSYSGGVYLSD